MGLVHSLLTSRLCNLNSSKHALVISTTKVIPLNMLQFLSFLVLILLVYDRSPAKTPSERSKLPRPEDFSKALYTFDIGQNDLSVGFRKMNFDQLRAAMPDIVNQLATAVQVSNNSIRIA
jgi:hypothetical protein